jgi:hypothetical protein
MRDEVTKNAKLDRTRALAWLFETVRNSVSSWYGTPSFSGVECEFYTLTEFFARKRRKVCSIYMKRHQSALKILCESMCKHGKTTKAMFLITDVDHYDDTDSDSETPHTETRLTAHELITVAHAWLTEQRDAIAIA